MASSSASTSFAISYTVKVNGIDDHTSNNKKDSPLDMSTHLTKVNEKKSPHSLNQSIKKNRNTNGTTIIRSKSFDNGKYGIGQRKSLNKSKTLSSFGHCPKKKRATENGSAECLQERQQCDNKRRRIFQSNIDQSPLWITLTHARTISDFNLES